VNYFSANIAPFLGALFDFKKTLTLFAQKSTIPRRSKFLLVTGKQKKGLNFRLALFFTRI